MRNSAVRHSRCSRMPLARRRYGRRCRHRKRMGCEFRRPAARIVMQAIDLETAERIGSMAEAWLGRMRRAVRFKRGVRLVVGRSASETRPQTRRGCHRNSGGCSNDVRTRLRHRLMERSADRFEERANDGFGLEAHRFAGSLKSSSSQDEARRDRRALIAQDAEDLGCEMQQRISEQSAIAVPQRPAVKNRERRDGARKCQNGDRIEAELRASARDLFGT